MGEILHIIKSWPGKGADENGIEHPASYHMLDVAAVAEHLVGQLTADRALQQALVLLAALHDLGKISASFRAMLRGGGGQPYRHWEITEALLRFHDGELLKPALGGSEKARFELYAAAAGHHGAPPGRELQFRSVRGRWLPWGDFAAMLRAAGDAAVKDAGEVIEAFAALWPEASLEGLDPAGAKKLSWRLAGLVNVADWVGSNTGWFRPCAPGPDPAQYLSRARRIAACALAEAGLATPPVAREGQLFDFSLRPAQKAALEVPLRDGPMLAILEDETGSGKTEAALILAHRMMLAGKGRGLYVALPTMATADAMFDRIRRVLRRLYDGAPSLALAHGRAPLHEGFRALARTRALDAEEPGPSEWLLDNRRRALLADVGVGTIDQALLAALRAKYAPLRQFGLARKILVVDEVHETGEPYIGSVLRRLLEIHAAQGGSAILLSATLPLALRAALVEAFERGAGRDAAPVADMAYPALTVPGVPAPRLAARPSPRGPVRVERVPTLEAALELVSEKAAGGAACVLIRNAVDEAIAAHAALRARGVDADLLHARFALCDRKRHENTVLRAFGRERAVRPGRVLVATQVVEASLDLDFDVMVSDLAPMASLIQRAGRLWRHMDERPAAERPVLEPMLHVLSPDPERVSRPDWAGPVLGRGAWVYDAASLWRTAKALFEAGEIRAPDNLRALIEAAEGEVPVPAALERAALEAAGEAKAKEALGCQNVIDWRAGYRRGAAGAPDELYPTRLGRPQLTLVLARREGAALVPWSGGEWDAESAQLSEVQASLARLEHMPLPDQTAPEITAVFDRLPRWMRVKRVLCPIGEDGAICNGLRYERESGLVFHDDAVRDA